MLILDETIIGDFLRTKRILLHLFLFLHRREIDYQSTKKKKKKKARRVEK